MGKWLNSILAYNFTPVSIWLRWKKKKENNTQAWNKKRDRKRQNELLFFPLLFYFFIFVPFQFSINDVAKRRLFCAHKTSYCSWMDTETSASCERGKFKYFEIRIIPIKHEQREKLIKTNIWLYAYSITNTNTHISFFTTTNFTTQ